MKRFFKIVFWIVLILFLFSFLSILLVLKFFPEKKVISTIKNQSELAGFPVNIQSIHWHFPSNVDIRHIEIRGKEWQTSESVPFFSLNQLSVKLKFLPLLLRRLDVSEVRIDRPRLNLDSSFFMLKPKTKPEKAPEKLKPLPLSFRLLRLGLDRFDLRMKLPAVKGNSEMILEGLCLDVSGIRVPRKWAESPGEIEGSIKLFTKQPKLSIRSPGMDFRLIPDVLMDLRWGKNKRWNLNMKAGVYSTRNEMDSTLGGTTSMQNGRTNGLKFSFSLDGTGYADSAKIRESVLSFGDEMLVRLAGEAFRVKENILFRVNAVSRPAAIKALKHSAELFLPDSLSRFLIPFDVQGRLNLLDGEIYGNLSEFQFRFTSGISNVSFQNRLPPVSVQNGDVSALFSGMRGKSGLQNGVISGKVRVGQVMYNLKDTVSFSLRGISADFNMNSDSRFIPKNGMLSGSVADVLKGRVLFGFTLKSGNSESFDPEKVLLNGEVRLDSMDVASLPSVQAGIGGKVNGTIQLKVNGTQHIRLSALVRTNGLHYLLQKQTETMPPLTVQADAFCRTQKPFQIWFLDSVRISSGDLFFIKASGKANLKETMYDFSIDRSMFSNDPFVRFLPKFLAEQMKGLKLFGNENLVFHLNGRGNGKSIQFMTQGKLIFDNVGISLPEQRVGIEGIQGEVVIHGPIENVKGNAEILVRNIFLDQIRATPLKDNRLQFGLIVKAPDSIRIVNGLMEIPMLATRGKFQFELGQMSQIPQMALSVEANLKASERLEVIRGLSLSGYASCQFQLVTLDPAKQQFRISGLIHSDSLSVFQEKLVEIRDIFCNVPFLLDVDVSKKCLLPKNEYNPLFWAEYESNRELLRHTADGFENVRIEKVVALDYQIGRILLDLHVDNGLVDIPWFSANLLSGNIGGGLRFDPKTGLPQDMVYSIRAQASRINSAQLRGLGIQTGEDTELDATLSFVGKGVDVNKLNLEGVFHITQIGPKFASTLLEQMDPKGSDRSIRLTRRLLNTGWKPKLLSFELRHGYVYPSLVLDQPWFSPLRIPDRVEYGRLPLEFFLKQKSMFQMK